MIRYYYQEGGGVTFVDPNDEENSHHSYRDYGLILNELNITEPVPKTDYIDVPYRDGSIDLSGCYGEENIGFEDRYIDMTFTDMTFRQGFNARFARLARNIAGKRKKIILDKDEGYYYLGRCTEISDPSISGDTAKVTVRFRIEPYKYSTHSANNRWEWDPFNFYTDMALDMGSYTVSGTLTKTINVGEKDVYPTITVSSDMTLEFEGKTYQLKQGAQINYDIRLKGGVPNVLTFKGNGTVTIDFVGGNF